MTQAKALSRPLEPGASIGILGGGQLGRMLALAAARLGFKTHIYSDQPDACAFQVAAARTYAPYDDKAALEVFAKTIAVATFEFENVPDGAVTALSTHVPASPGPNVLRVTQDRLEEKSFVNFLGLETVVFAEVNNEIGARAALELVGGKGVLKTRRFGYDGKGQAKVTNAIEAASAIKSFKYQSSIMEAFVDFDYEVSVIAARGYDGAFVAYDPPENEHGDHILRRSIVPSRLGSAQTAEAIQIAQWIAEDLDYVGVLCVELFVTKDGKLLVNEIAPRVHNSGHWTMDACVTSQFEQHIRAIAGWPLGDTKRHSDAVMDNIIGADVENWLALAKKPAGLHLYGKKDARPGRKMGHITTLHPLNTLKRS